MDDEALVSALAALGQPTRMAIVRMLAAAGGANLPSSEIARRAGIPATTTSTHLTILHRAGLLTKRRRSREIVYSLNTERLQLAATALAGGRDA